jgi:regulator of sirC expression with transglutaminase-like and TPR domain
MALLLGLLGGCGSAPSHQQLHTQRAPESPEQLWTAARGDVLAFVNLLHGQLLDSSEKMNAMSRSRAAQGVAGVNRFGALIQAHRSNPAALLNALVYDSLQIEFDSSRTDLYNIFPAAVVQRKKGSCIGIALLYLSLARSGALPLWGVLVPGHFFVRTPQGDSTVGMDVLKHGEHRSDSWYREKFGVSDTSSLYLRALDDAQVAAVVAFNLANWYAAQASPALAEVWYAWSCAQLPLHAAGWGNRALNLSRLKRFDEALGMLDRAESLGAAALTVAQNRATLWALQERWDLAAVHYRRGLHSAPRDGELLYGLSYALYKQGKIDESRSVLAQLLHDCPHHGQAAQLARLLQADHF